jgi:DNA-directed RNA polymerase specialized sigma24 family protein
LSEDIWQALFSALHRAGIEYAGLHRLVTAFFVGWKCGVDSEALADVTLDRLAMRVNGGESVRNFISYSLNIADKVYKEYCRDREKLRVALRELKYLTPNVHELEEEVDVRRECQKMCIKTLSATEHQLVVDYYLNGKDRSLLAAELGIPLATLRTKIHRLNLRLAKCAEDCRRLA